MLTRPNHRHAHHLHLALNTACPERSKATSIQQSTSMFFDTSSRLSSSTSGRCLHCAGFEVTVLYMYSRGRAGCRAHAASVVRRCCSVGIKQVFRPGRQPECVRLAFDCAQAHRTHARALEHRSPKQSRHSSLAQARGRHGDRPVAGDGGRTATRCWPQGCTCIALIAAASPICCQWHFHHAPSAAAMHNAAAVWCGCVRAKGSRRMPQRLHLNYN